MYVSILTVKLGFHKPHMSMCRYTLFPQIDQMLTSNITFVISIIAIETPRHLVVP